MNNILVLGKTDAGRMMLKRKKICCNELLSDLMNDKASLSDGNEEFSFKVTGEPFFMHVDPQLMRHVFYNLLSNASKYSQGSSHIPEVHAHYRDQELHIKFRDYGIGIPDDEIRYLFTSFYRASNTINIQGIGLGLVIVKQLVEMHGGTVSVESSFGDGSEFTLILPKQPREHEENFNS
jgi:signal transduction histidine kinase